MRYLIILPLTLVTLFSTAWAPPSECADRDREIYGNRASPCELVFPEIESVVYEAVMEYPTCTAQATFHVPGMTATNRVEESTMVGGDTNTFEFHVSSWPHGWQFPQGHELIAYYSEDKVVFPFRTYKLTSRVPGRSPWIYANIAVRAYVGLLRGYGGYYVFSNILPAPNISAHAGLVNACLDLVRQEKQRIDNEAAAAAAEAEANAQATAIADAANKEKEQAEREAALQARLAKLEIVTATGAKLKVEEAELLKTQTVAKQLEHQKELGEIFRETVRIRLAAQEDRAKLLNDYLLAASTTVANFDEEVRAFESKIQQYIEFNQLLLTALETYHTGLIERLNRANESVDEQQQRVSDLEREIKQLETELQ